MPDDQPLGVPPSEFHPERPAAPFKKRGNVKTAILVGILIVVVDILIYFFLIRPDDSQLLKAIEPLKPAENTTPSMTNPEVTQGIVPSQAVTSVADLAKEDLAKRLHISTEEISVVSEKQITWNDGSLGCPQPDMMYTQALVEGSQVVLSAKNNRYDYHAGPNDKPFLCDK